MRTLEGHLRMRLTRKLRSLFLSQSLTTQLSDGDTPSASIPEATDLGHRIAEQIDGVPISMATETLFGIPSTAHILGGCVMGDSADSGVIDHRHRVHGYDGLYVIDGSAVSANPGVNPSLTICALAERAMTFIPERSALSDTDPRCPARD
jgi:cholesterol oxidase